MSDLLRLLSRAGAGDHGAQTELYARFNELVRSQAHRKIQLRLRRWRHPMLAILSTGDVVQDVFRDLFRDLGDLRFTSDEQFVGLLATLVEHRLVDQVRRYHAARRDVRRQVAVDATELGEPVDWNTPLELAVAHEDADIFHELVGRLPLRERALLEMRLCERTPFEEAARMLAYPSADTARKAFYRAHARLLVRLKRRGVGPPTGGGAGRERRERRECAGEPDAPERQST